LDNNLSPHYARALTDLSRPDGHTVVHLSDKFPRNTKDEVWLPALAVERDWVVICGDLRIFRVPLLRKIWGDSKLTTFFLAKGWMNQPFWDQAWWLVRWWPTIVGTATAVQAGYGYEVPAKSSGKLRPLPGIRLAH
jgi:hypothetical protein